MKRFLALVTSVMLLWSCTASSVTALAAANSSATIEKESDVPTDALHFILRHWHVAEDGDVQLQGDTLQSGDRFFVVAEGYIVPVDDGTYRFFLAYQDGTTDKPLLEITEDQGFVNDSTYIEDIDVNEGFIVLKSKPLTTADGVEEETFSTFSVSAGHSAVEYVKDAEDGDDLKITYDRYVHLVKAHAFYIRKQMEVAGASFEVVRGDDTDDTKNNAEYDTVWGYTYKSGVTGHTEGEIVKDKKGDIVMRGSALPGGVNATDVVPTKIYSAQLGLHTDKTAEPVKDASSYDKNGKLITDEEGNFPTRTFNLDLEAWYAEGYSSQVGMVLDASGSMVIASDMPKQIILTEEQITAIETATGTEIKLVTSADPNQNGGWDSYFLTDDQLLHILNPTHTDNSQLSASGYSYFVDSGGYNPLGYWEGVPDSTSDSPGIAKTADGRVLGSINYINSTFTNTKNKQLNHRQAGWYFISHAGAYDDHYRVKDLETGKRLLGVSGSQNKGSGTDIAYKHTYTPPRSDMPVKFYLDEAGELCCFFCTSNSAPVSSYVYELADSDYIRTEALQRALGVFVTKLREKSPSSRVSAVRFSSSSTELTGNRLSELVLLDWTEDPAESATIMSLMRGDGGALGSTTSSTNHLEQYNFGLTGATSTWRGLQAYIDNLTVSGRDNPYDADAYDDVPKYLIIFTDGADSDRSNGDSQKAKNLADQLKNKGYTIFTVLLDGSSMSKTEYDTAEEFLLTLAGKKTYGLKADGVTRETANDYFFSVTKGKEILASQGEDISDMNDADILTAIFADEILTEITHPLDQYTITDYIDPRFDLVDANNVVWHLQSGGKVTKDDGSTIQVSDVTDPDDESAVTIALSNISTQEARTPFLCYDEGRDLYYLEWVNQTIPGSAVDASILPIWKARVTICAKDDFIGGNAVLTNGIEEKMNWVRSQSDPNPSSDANHSVLTDDNPYPSKGFPRTSVNVAPPKEEIDMEQTIYMGEPLYSSQIAVEVIQAAYDNSLGLERYNWEYIERFVNYCNDNYHTVPNQDFIDLIETYHQTKRTALMDEEKERGDEPNIISDRLYELITTKGALTVVDLSEWLVEKDENDAYSMTLILPYIYLPDDPSTPLNSTGTSTHLGDVVGYLRFHVQERLSSDHLNGDNRLTYPDGPTTHTITRISELTVTFVVETAANRGVWNNTYVVQERDENGELIYRREVDKKPAAGLEVTGLVIQSSLTTNIVSGEVTLQVLVENAAKLAGERVYYTAELVRTYPSGTQTVVGTLTVNDTIRAGKSLYRATFTPNEHYMGYGLNDSTQFGLPIGTYSLQNASGNAPDKYHYDGPTLLTDPAAYVNNDLSLFTKGTGYNQRPELQYLAVFDGDQALLGTGDGVRKYTDKRFALFQVNLTAGRLTVRKVVSGADGDQTQDFPFMITLSDKTLDGPHGDVTFSGGVANFTLRHGQSVTVTGLPEGVSYTVTELGAESDGYAVTATGASGTISTEADAVAAFINFRDTTPVPQTDDDASLSLWLALLLTSAAAAALVVKRRKRS